MKFLEELCDYEKKTGIKDSYRRQILCLGEEEKVNRRECDLRS